MTASTMTSRMVSQIGRITGDDQNHEVYGCCGFATRILAPLQSLLQPFRDTCLARLWNFQRVRLLLHSQVSSRFASGS